MPCCNSEARAQGQTRGGSRRMAAWSCTIALKREAGRSARIVATRNSASQTTIASAARTSCGTCGSAKRGMASLSPRNIAARRTAVAALTPLRRLMPPHPLRPLRRPLRRLWARRAQLTGVLAQRASAAQPRGSIATRKIRSTPNAGPVARSEFTTTIPVSFGPPGLAKSSRHRPRPMQRRRSRPRQLGRHPQQRARHRQAQHRQHQRPPPQRSFRRATARPTRVFCGRAMPRPSRFICTGCRTT
mmetsp:Transcript_96309/g.241436  ORF Transcript_96309/g.241436 Transcript_96309/m.241436 type:complete len:245 (+) Transcript_96309:252-986(+)